MNKQLFMSDSQNHITEFELRKKKRNMAGELIDGK